MFVAMKRALAFHIMWARILSLLKPLSVNQMVNVRCDGNGAVVAASSWLV